MAEVKQTMKKLATSQGIDVSQSIRPPNIGDNQINFPSWAHNNLNHNQFMCEDLVASERTVEINQANPPKGMYELNPQDNLFALQQKMQVQIETMTKAIQQILQQLQGTISKKPQQAFMCEECGGGHQTSKCTKVPTEEVNYMGGQQRPHNNFQQRCFQNIHGN